MLNLINKIYQKDNITIDLFEAIGIKNNELKVKIDDLYKQIFLEYATWYLELKEKELGITKRLDTIEKRRAHIKTRLISIGTATKEMLISVASSVPTIVVEIDFKDMMVIVKYLEVANNQYLALAKNAIAEIIPYHLNLILDYERVKWEEVKKVKWDNLLAYTWGDLNNSVKGTIEWGLSSEFD